MMYQMKFRLFSFILILSILIGAVGMPMMIAQAAGNTYYVDKTVSCSDAWPGTISQPFCTIQKGADVARAGTTVDVLHGNYAETVFLTDYSGTAGNPITVHAEPGVTVTGNSAGFGSAFAVSSVSYVVIDGFNITQTTYKGIYVDSASHITLSNNHVTYAGINQGPTNHQQGIYVKNTTNSTITNNIADHNSCIGIWLIDHSDYNLISNNVSFGNTSTVAYPTVVISDAAGIDLTSSSHNTVINNIVYANEDSGINLYLSGDGIPSSYNLVEGNLSYGNGDHGIDNNNSAYNTLIGNTVQGNGTVGINFEGDSSATGSHHATAINNISVGNGFTPPNGSFGGNLRVDSASVNGTILDYNLFYRQSASVQIVWDDDDYSSLAAFRAVVSGQEAHGLEGDPLFVSPAPSVLRTDGDDYLIPINVGDYHLYAGSPAIDSANSGAPNEPDNDIEGHARVDDPATTNTGAGTRTYDDRGAYEFLLSGPSQPSLTTQAVTNVTVTSATLNATVTNLGSSNPTEFGFAWGTSSNPTIAGNRCAVGSVTATGPFSCNITGLTPLTLYHVRAYATNAVGTVYANDETFTTLGILPTVTTQAVTNITTTTATGNGNITILGVPNPTQYGVVWDTNINPTIALSTKTQQGVPSGAGAFTGSITGLTQGTLYHVRAYATNSMETSYGEDVTFTTMVAIVTTFTTTGAGNWTAPAGVSSLTVEVWGGGGRGGSITSGSSEVAGGGGGGGGYSKSVITVTPGQSYAYFVGAGSGTTSPGQDSYFINASTLMAKGGNSAADNSLTAATGGSSTTGAGTTKYSGGNGASGSTGSNRAGGGGSSAGTGANGTAATNATGATAPTGGGNGGNGKASPSGNGTGGTAPGGGGGGAYRSSGSTTYTGGSGANGQVRLTYYVNGNSTTTNVNCGAGNPAVEYGSSISCVATVTAASGTTSPTGTVSWSTNGAGSIVTSPCTLSGTGRTASCSATYTPVSVGTGSHLITAGYSGDLSFLSSNGSQALTVNKKAAYVTPNAASKTLGQSDPSLTGVLNGFLPADNVTATYSRVAGETVGTYTISAALGAQAGVLNNYNITYNTAVFTIVPAPTYTLTINIVGNGTVAKSPDQASYLDGTVVTLAATPGVGWSFGGWSANVVNGSVTIYGNTTVTATFIQTSTNVVLNAPTGTQASWEWDKTFRWTGIPSAEYYHTQVYDAASNTLLQEEWYNLAICSGLNCAVSPSETRYLGNGQYKWRVQTYGTMGYTPWTEYVAFTINSPAITLTAPSGTISNWDKYFRWTGIASAEYYHTQVYDAVSNTLLQEEWYNLAICNGLNCAVSLTETRNLANGTYRWRVQSYGSEGYTPWTGYITFTLNYPTIVLNMPSGTLTSWNNTFHWTGLTSAEYYHVQVYTAGGALVQEEWYNLAICSGLECAVSPVDTQNLANGDYKWRVQSYGTGGYTPWTDYRTFTLNK
jgi:parallel beta-helix repeat protein